MGAEHCGVKWRPWSHLCVWTLIKRAPFPPISDIEHTRGVMYSVATDKPQLWKAPIVRQCGAGSPEFRVGYLSAWKELKSDPRGDWPECLITLGVNKAGTAGGDHKAGPVALATESSISFNILFTASDLDARWLIRMRGKDRMDAHSLTCSPSQVHECIVLLRFLLTDFNRTCAGSGKYGQCARNNGEKNKPNNSVVTGRENDGSSLRSPANTTHQAVIMNCVFAQTKSPVSSKLFDPGAFLR